MIPVVVCIKVGDKYGPEYVNRLAAMVERHTTIQHYFLCLTDDPTGLECAHAPIGTDLPGWWSKLQLFNPESALQAHRVFFLDLDTIIVGNIDLLLAYDGPFAILKDFYRPSTFGSAIMSIAPGFGQEIWTKFTPSVMQGYAGDQDWIYRCLFEVPVSRWQDDYPGQIVSYKVHCQDGIPDDARIICFHGVPKPTDLAPDNILRREWESYDRTPVTR